MNLQSRAREAPEINLTSLIDVVLLLLVFFMVSTSFVHESELNIVLPEASLAPALAEEGSLELAITAEGAYWLNDRQLINNAADTLRRALREAAGEGAARPPLTIRADARTTHQSVVTAMDVAGRLGFVEISIVTVNEQD